MYQNTFTHGKKEKLGNTYIISRDQEDVLIKYCIDCPVAWNNPDYDYYTMNVKNIPAFNKALLSVFQTSENSLYSVNVEANGELINIAVDMKKHGAENIVIWNNTDLENPKLLKISFDTGQVNRQHRTPTAVMIWLTETLQKIYDEWQKEITSPGRVISLEEYVNKSGYADLSSNRKITALVTEMMKNFEGIMKNAEGGIPYTGNMGLIINVSGQGIEYEWLHQHFRIKKSEVDCIYFMVTDEAYTINISDYKKRIRGIIEISQPDLDHFARLFTGNGYRVYLAVFGELSDRICFSDASILTNNGEFVYPDLKKVTVAEDACFRGEYYVSIYHQKGNEIYRYKTEFPHALEKIRQHKQLSIPIEVLPKVATNPRDNYWDRFNKVRLYNHKYSYTLYSIFDTRIRLRYFRYDEHGSKRGVEFKLEESCLSGKAAQWALDQLHYIRSNLKINETHWRNYEDEIVKCTIHDEYNPDKINPRTIKLCITNDSVLNEFPIEPVQEFMDYMANFIGLCGTRPK